MSLIDVKLSMTRCPWLLGRTDSAGSVVLARSASATPSSFARYGPRAGPRLAHSSAYGSICFAIASLPTESARLGCPTPNSCEVPCVAPPSGHRCNPCAGGLQSAGRARRRLKLSSAAPWLPAVSLRRSWTTPRIRRADASRLVGASRKGAGNGLFEDGPAPDWTMIPAKSGHAVMKPHAPVPICDDLPPKGRALLLTHTRFIPWPTGSQRDHSLLSTTQDRKGDSPGA